MRNCITFFMKKKELKFTRDEVSSIMYEDGISDEEGNEIYITVEEDIVSSDTEKGSIEIEYVIKEVATGKFYKATLGKSPWYKQGEHNAKQTWTEVKAKKTTKITYK